MRRDRWIEEKGSKRSLVGPVADGVREVGELASDKGRGTRTPREADEDCVWATCVRATLSVVLAVEARVEPGSREVVLLLRGTPVEEGLWKDWSTWSRVNSLGALLSASAMNGSSCAAAEALCASISFSSIPNPLLRAFFIRSSCSFRILSAVRPSAIRSLKLFLGMPDEPATGLDDRIES